MTVSAAQLLVTIGGNAAGAQAAITSTAAMLGKTGMLGMAAVGAGAIMAATGVIATKMAGDFQAGITSLVTGAGESEKNIQLVSNGIKQLALDTGTSTQQLIAGMYMIESGGYHGATGLNILKAAAEGAKVGNADLGVVADATDTILKNFGDTGINAAQVVNTLIATVANGKTHMEDLANSLSAVLPTASAAGIGLNDVMGAMATMTAEGVPAAEAATYLRQTIVALAAPGSQAKAVLESIGLSSTKVASDMQKSLPMTIKEITDALGKKFPVGSAQYIAAVREITGGMRQMQGFLDIGGKNIDRYTELVNKVGLAVKNGGDKVTGWNLVQQTFNQSMDKAGATLQVLMIDLGEKLLPVATNFFNWLSGTAIPDLQHFASWITSSKGKMEDLKPVLISAAAIIGGVLTASFIAWAGAAAGAAVATIAATWPVLAVGALLGGLAAVIILLVQHWNDLTKAGGPLHGMLMAIQPVLAFLGNLFGVLGKIWTTQILPALAQLLPILKILGIVIGVILLAAVGTIVVGLIVLVVAVTGVILIITKLVEAIVFAITHFGDFLGAIGNFFGTVFGAIGNFFGNLFGTIGGFFGNILGSLGKFKDSVVAKAQELATNFMNALSSLPGKLLKLGEQLMQNLGQGIKNAAGNVTSALKNVPIIGGIAGQLNNVIPHFATGGVMAQSGLALVGEQGPELVYLPSGARISPNVGGGGAGGDGYGNGQPIVIQLNLDGKRLAQATLPHLHTLIRTGTGNRKF